MVPLRLVGLLVGLEGGARPRSYRGPALAELGHPDVTTGDAACLRRYSKGTVLSTLLQGHPSSLRFGHPDVAYG